MNSLITLLPLLLGIAILASAILLSVRVYRRTGGRDAKPRLFQAPSGWIRTVPGGFSWAAFFLGPIWAFANRAWLLGLLLAVASIAVKFAGGLGETIGALVSLAFVVALGWYGRRWLAWSLEKQGYTEIGERASVL